MANIIHNNIIDCAGIVKMACLAANSSLTHAEALFKGKQFYEMNFPHRKEEQRMVEVFLDRNRLMCLFDRHDVCIGAFLFLYEAMDILHFIAYFNDAYHYDFLLRSWIVNNCIIEVNIPNGECGLLIMPLDKRRNSK